MMPMEIQYRIIFQAVTPRRHAQRQANDLWVLEVTDDFTLAQNKAIDIYIYIMLVIMIMIHKENKSDHATAT